jgi:hypothetical protein
LRVELERNDRQRLDIGPGRVVLSEERIGDVVADTPQGYLHQMVIPALFVAESSTMFSDVEIFCCYRRRFNPCKHRQTRTILNIEEVVRGWWGGSVVRRLG